MIVWCLASRKESDAELRARLLGGIRNKAARGELRRGLAIGERKLRTHAASSGCRCAGKDILEGVVSTTGAVRIDETVALIGCVSL
jgi:hypothetical protein